MQVGFISFMKYLRCAFRDIQHYSGRDQTIIREIRIDSLVLTRRRLHQLLSPAEFD
jgi:hypothetical protein